MHCTHVTICNDFQSDDEMCYYRLVLIIIHSSVFIRHVNMPEMYVVLAGNQTVACDFRDIYICGYTTSKTGNISWERVNEEILGRSAQDERGIHVYELLKTSLP